MVGYAENSLFFVPKAKGLMCPVSGSTQNMSVQMSVIGIKEAYCVHTENEPVGKGMVNQSRWERSSIYLGSWERVGQFVCLRVPDVWTLHSCRCQTCSNPESSSKMALTTRSLHVWKVTFPIKIGQRLNETCSSRYIVSDKNADSCEQKFPRKADVVLLTVQPPAILLPTSYNDKFGWFHSLSPLSPFLTPSV